MTSWLLALPWIVVLGAAVWLVVFLPLVGVVVAALLLMAAFGVAGAFSAASEARAARRRGPT